MINQNELLQLFERIANGTASNHDLQVYNEWCNSFQAENVPVQRPFEEKQMKILAALNERISSGRRINHMKWSAAAAILLICTVAAFTWRHKQATVSANWSSGQAQVQHNPNSTVLILADGTQVELGATQKGKIGQQSGTYISKKSDSSLVYVFNGKNTSGNSAVVQYNSLVIGKGQQFQLQLPDGTKVWINAGSSLKFPVNFQRQPQREVILSGEAYFEVASYANKPFVVATACQKIEVLGTNFNVESYPEDSDSRTTLLEGTVRINHQLELSPGEQAIVRHSGETDKKHVNTAAVVAWKNGYFSFDGESIYDIMPKLGRWYDMEVSYDENLPGDKFEASISRSRSMTDVLDFLQRTKLVKFRIEGHRIIVSRYQ
ncbi:FecR family protein [Chitinophaga sp. Ak27]|uniref:FecR family protein n=1 Tax=Chitinophaga sp. Ak27 TaxID=2726116 RepID=UPI00145CF59B|nr:FecR domain-containing protein [Chitinophaga sp. Ak27]NLU90483.1 DUF4974 domain-containing protein [Chitinophaga sp. Ak27]